MIETDLCTNKLRKAYLERMVTSMGYQSRSSADRDPRITSNFWRSYSESDGYRLDKVRYQRVLQLPHSRHFMPKSSVHLCGWADREARLTGPELVHETTEKKFNLRREMQALGSPKDYLQPIEGISL
ncbi:hypothetical protein Tco_0626128 [Tanacetum coccineum]|uniref:Uncharacterized protein n=1 Tax=Tanacetum coccineum TaxID=301880 RepID=A0ABQ4WIQ8_9ASTR